MNPQQVKLVEACRRMAQLHGKGAMDAVDALASALDQAEEVSVGRLELYEAACTALDRAMELIKKLQETNAQLTQAMFFAPQLPRIDA